MKRVVPIICICIISMLVACGKNDINQTNNTNQNDVVENNNTAAEELEDNNSNVEEEAVLATNLVEPSEEIVNSDITDGIVQVYDVVVPLDGSMTVGDFITLLNDSVDCGIVIKDVNENSIAETGKNVEVIVEDENGDDVCRLIYAAFDEPGKVYDCPIIEVMEGYFACIHNLNIFYAGNICPGIYVNSEKTEYISSPEYQERIKDYPIIDFDALEDYLNNKGFYNVEYEEDDYTSALPYYKAFCVSGLASYEREGEKYYPVVQMKFMIDLTTGSCSGISRSTSWGKEDFISFEMFLDSLEGISEEDVSVIDESLRPEIDEQVSGEYSIYGWCFYRGVDTSDIEIIYKTADNQFFRASVDVGIRADGSIGCEHLVQSFILLYSSIDELIDSEPFVEEVNEFTF